MFKCKICNKPARLDNGVITRSCEHESVVIADMEAVAYGEGKSEAAPVKGGPFDLFQELLKTLVDKLRGS